MCFQALTPPHLPLFLRAATRQLKNTFFLASPNEVFLEQHKNNNSAQASSVSPVSQYERIFLSRDNFNLIFKHAFQRVPYGLGEGGRFCIFTSYFYVLIVGIFKAPYSLFPVLLERGGGPFYGAYIAYRIYVHFEERST